MLLPCLFNRIFLKGLGIQRINKRGDILNVLSTTSISRDKEVTVIHNEENNGIKISLPYINEYYRINKTFSFIRKQDEKCSFVLSRITAKVNTYVEQRLKKKGFDDEDKVDVIITLIKKDDNLNDNNADTSDLLIFDVLENAEDYIIRIGDVDYKFNVNPPILNKLTIGKRSILSGFFLYPTIDGVNSNINETVLQWFRTRIKFGSYSEVNLSKLKEWDWERVGEGFTILTTDDDISRLFKVTGTPCKGSQRGEDSVSVSAVLVSKGPDSCPFEKRHKFTSQPLSHDLLRVVSYNLLADFYADSEYSRTVLFRCCATYALDIEYRKQLLIKEILGYNADVICLQEVDKDLFSFEFQPLLNNLGFEGVFDSKKGIPEGLATFYRKSKLQIKGFECYHLSSELTTNDMFVDLREKLSTNNTLIEKFDKKNSIFQITVFRRVENPSQLLVVGTTHLFSGSLSNHIRLLQTGMCLELLKQTVNVQKIQNPEVDISTLFCGDFNSIPQSGVYQLITAQSIEKDHLDWSSKETEEISNVSFSHDFKMESACGTPQYTNFTVDFKGCLDYIFFQSDKFDVEQIVPFPTEEELTENEALPSVKIPSDHLALIADLKWKS